MSVPTDVAAARIDVAAARIDVLQRLVAAFPDRATGELTALADWAVSGAPLLDAARIDRAAQVIAHGLGESYSSPAVEARSRGLAVAVLTAYHADA